MFLVWLLLLLLLIVSDGWTLPVSNDLVDVGVVISCVLYWDWYLLKFIKFEYELEVYSSVLCFFNLIIIWIQRKHSE